VPVLAASLAEEPLDPEPAPRPFSARRLAAL